MTDTLEQLITDEPQMNHSWFVSLSDYYYYYYYYDTLKRSHHLTLAEENLLKELSKFTFYFIITCDFKID